MKGEELKSHKFPGVYDVEFFREGLALTIDARGINAIDHLNNKIVPTAVVRVNITNKAGHAIPYG